MPDFTSFRTCSLCEATCGVLIEVVDDRVKRIRGDQAHPDSRGHICPKASGLAWLHEDPDRITTPMVRSGSDWTEVGWEEAFHVIADRLEPIMRDHGPRSIGTYVGNPASYDLALLLYGPALFRLSRNRFSPATVDSLPKQLASALMFGGDFTVPIPDLDRTDHLWILGANPAASNGSMVIAPDFMGRLDRIRERGGTVVVFDPRRTRTAERATEHVAIRPGGDALLLAAVVNVLVSDDLVRLRHLAPLVRGLETVAAAIQPFTPERVAQTCGVDAVTIRRLTHALADSPSAVVYGRLGTCTQEFGTLASWLLDVVNILTGNLDRPGGAMFAWPVTGSAATNLGPPQPPRRGRWSTRVRGAVEVMGELPAACLSEEILGIEEDRIRALLTVAGNPALSVPDPRLPVALDTLDLHVAFDIYLNETTRHADVFLPAESHLQRPHFPVTQHLFMLRQVAKWSDPVFAPDPDRPRDWEVALRLFALLDGRGLDVDTQAIDDELFSARVHAATRQPGGTVGGRSPAEIVSLSVGRGPERLVDFMIRTGPYGDGYGADPGGLSLAVVRDHPHGLDLGGPEPRLPGILRTESGQIELAPELLVSDLPRLEAAIGRPRPRFMLIGRRNLRSNNSWMHNLPGLARGRTTSQLLMNPDDARDIGVDVGRRATVRGARAEVVVDVELDDAMLPGVVSLPHGWGHDQQGSRLGVAKVRPGANSNLLADPSQLEPLSGSSIVNGVPVEVFAAGRPTP